MLCFKIWFFVFFIYLNNGWTESFHLREDPPLFFILYLPLKFVNISTTAAQNLFIAEKTPQLFAISLLYVVIYIGYTSR